jgi:hypothetical protein
LQDAFSGSEVSHDLEELKIGQRNIVSEAIDQHFLRTSGARTIWLLNNGFYSSSIGLPGLSTLWHIAGAADFDGGARLL